MHLLGKEVCLGFVLLTNLGTSVSLCELTLCSPGISSQGGKSEQYCIILNIADAQMRELLAWRLTGA